MTATLDPLGEAPACGRVVGTTLAPSQLVKARLHVGTESITRLVALRKQAQRCRGKPGPGYVVMKMVAGESSQEERRERDESSAPPT